MPITDGDPEVFVTVCQTIDGEKMQVIRKVDLIGRAQCRISLADAAIDEGLAELRHYQMARRRAT